MHTLSLRVLHISAAGRSPVTSFGPAAKSPEPDEEQRGQADSNGKTDEEKFGPNFIFILDDITAVKSDFSGRFFHFILRLRKMAGICAIKLLKTPSFLRIISDIALFFSFSNHDSVEK